MDEKRRLKAGIPLTLLEPIGSVTVNFAMLEGNLESFIWDLIGQDTRLGQIITAQLSFRQLIDLFGSLYCFRVRSLKFIAKYEAITKLLRQAEEKRNKIIHSQWAAGDTPESSTRIKTRARGSKGLAFTFEHTAKADILKIADFLAELSYKVQQLMIEYISSGQKLAV